MVVSQTMLRPWASIKGPITASDESKSPWCSDWIQRDLARL